MKEGLAFSILVLFIVTSVKPITFGFDQDVKQLEGEDLNYDSFNVFEKTERNFRESDSPPLSSTTIIAKSEDNISTEMNPILPITLGLMDSAWPMYCHDLRHTGRSPYSTASNSGIEVWRFRCGDYVQGGGVSDQEGNIYFGSRDRYLYSLNQNGTLRWRFSYNDIVESSLAIDENGTIYFGGGGPFDYNYFFALNPNGTLKWKFKTYRIHSSPAIGLDGTIYFGSENNYIYALNPNGTLKWRYKTNHVVYSSPAIGDDGTIYCGSHDSKLYALNPNGTLKWKFDTGNWIRVSPCIGDDGTIYCVSLDNYLYAINPNGTMKWKTNVGAGTSPTIGLDGTIYCGYDKLKAINPDGSLKWQLELGEDRTIRGGTPCHSVDGTIYLGATIYPYWGGEIIAVDSNGIEKWRKMIANDEIEFAPFISEDGTVYIGSTSFESDDGSYGCLHAFNSVENNTQPDPPTINGPETGKAGMIYFYRFCSIDPDNHPIGYYIDWGDGESEWTMDHVSNRTIRLGHIWRKTGNYTIACKARDSVGDESNWAYFDIEMYPSVSVEIKVPEEGWLYFRNYEIIPLPNTIIFGNIKIKTSAISYDSSIKKVEFYVDGILRKIDIIPPYEWRWRLSSHIKHRHIIKVVAYDRNGASSRDEIEVLKFL